MSDRVYIDTSALAKWYLNETNSDKFAKYIQSISSAIISDLTITEMRSLLARRRRMHEIAENLEMEIFAIFQTDIDQGFLTLLPIESSHFERATHIISSLPNTSLRTLDALHLTIIKHHHLQIIATADQNMIAAAKQMQIEVHEF